jgi:hypothetical protein
LPFRAVGTLLLAGIALLVLVLLAPRLLGRVSGPEGEIITALKESESDGIELTLPEGTLRSTRLQFERISVTVDASARKAVAVATLDFVGRFADTEVSSLGVERIPFEYDGWSWKPESGFAPRLAAAVSLLERRRRALAAGSIPQLLKLIDPPDEPRLAAHPALQKLQAARDRDYRARAWYLRLDREGAVATEEYRMLGSLPDRPLDERGSRRLTLQRRDAEFLFLDQLM